MNNIKKIIVIIAILAVILTAGKIARILIGKNVQGKKALEHIHDREVDAVEWIYSFGNNTEIKSMEGYEIGGILVFRVEYSYESKHVYETGVETIKVDGAIINQGDLRWILVNYNWPEEAIEDDKQYFDLVEEAVNKGIRYSYSNEEIAEIVKKIELND